MVKFSIIVPVYNVEKYLKECIDSLINQTYKNIEIILIDDGSPDNSPQICDEYAKKDSRIKVVHKENGGVVSARAAGVDVSTGDYFVFVDADDWVALDLCEKVNSVIKSSSPDMICFGFSKVLSDNILKIKNNYEIGFYNKEDIEKKIFPSLIHTKNATNFVLSLWGKVIKRDIYIHNQLKGKKVIIAEDAACVIPCIYHSESMFIMDESFYFYRIIPTSAMLRKKVILWEGPKNIYTHISEHIDIDNYDLREQLYRLVVHQLFFVVMSQFNKKSSYWKIRKEIKENLKEPIYRECIKNAGFSRLACKITVYSLRYKLFFLIYLYNKKKKTLT